MKNSENIIQSYNRQNFDPYMVDFTSVCKVSDSKFGVNKASFEPLIVPLNTIILSLIPIGLLSLLQKSQLHYELVYVGTSNAFLNMSKEKLQDQEFHMAFRCSIILKVVRKFVFTHGDMSQHE